MRRSRNTIRNPNHKPSKRERKNSVLFDISLDLHGDTAEEAVRRVQQIVGSKDNCTVLVNHGKGSGTLRLAVRRFISQNSRIVEVRKGEEIGLPEGDGVTIIRL